VIGHSHSPLTVFTATVDTSTPSSMWKASAFNTLPNAPWPSTIPRNENITTEVMLWQQLDHRTEVSHFDELPFVENREVKMGMVCQNDLLVLLKGPQSTLNYCFSCGPTLWPLQTGVQGSKGDQFGLLS